MITIYGIPNCDTIKKARRWLDTNQLDYSFHDYKKAGIDKSTLDEWSERVGWETLLNRRGTTWRKLPDQIKDTIDAESAIDAMIENPSLIKRPVMTSGETILVGFSEQSYQEHLTG